jgi:hypothetical protein
MTNSLPSLRGFIGRICATCASIVLLNTVNPASADPSLRAFAGNADFCFGSRTGEREGVPLALGLAFGSAVVRSSLPALGRYLTNAAQSTSSQIMTAISDADLFRIRAEGAEALKLEPNLECLVVVTGVFGELDPRRFPQGYWDNFDPDRIFVKSDAGQLDFTTLRRLGLVDLPNSYMEFRFDRHASAEAFRLKPLIAYFRMSNASRNTQAAKNIEITVTITKPSPTGALDISKPADTGGLVAQIPIVLKQLIPGRIKRGPITNFDTVWIAEPKFPSDTQMNDAKKLVGTEGILTIGPSNVFVTYREVDEPDLMLHILASIVSENSSQISSSLEEALRSVMTKSK